MSITNILLASVCAALMLVVFGLFHKTYILAEDQWYFCSENQDGTLTCTKGIEGYRDHTFLVKRFVP